MTVRDPWMATDAKDKLGRKFKIGDQVARATSSGRAVNLDICEVTRLEDGKVYLDNSKAHVHFPVRLLIVTAIVAKE